MTDTQTKVTQALIDSGRMTIVHVKEPTSTPSPKAASTLVERIESGLSMFDDEADDAMGATDCPNGCQTDPDGTCLHGYESAAVTARLI